jgi:hypothetical protein
MNTKKKSTNKRDAPSLKKEHAYAYIKSIVESDMVDRSAYIGQDKSVYLPYRKVSFFYGEYKFVSKDRGVHLFAGESTFRKAFKQLVQVRYNCLRLFLRY